MVETPGTYRVSLSPFRPTTLGIESLVGALVPKGFRTEQFCLVATAPAISAMASAINPTSAMYPQLSHLVTNLEEVHAPELTVPIVASVGPILDVLLKKRSWLSSSEAVPLHQHLENGDVVVAVNALDHDQFVHVTGLLLRHGDGNVVTHMFHRT